MTRDARASLSMKGGGKGRAASCWYLQLILVGCCTAAGGMITLIPQCLCPVMAPPRASTRKLTRKPALEEGSVPCVGFITSPE